MIKDFLLNIRQEEKHLQETREVTSYTFRFLSYLLFPMFFRPTGYEGSLILSSTAKGS